jgi:methylated-DNA-[protein]-cysteine S-methyltransferase
MTNGAEQELGAGSTEQSACLDTPFGPIGLRWRPDVVTGVVTGVVTRVALTPGPDWPTADAVPDWLRAPIEAYLEHPSALSAAASPDEAGRDWNRCSSLAKAPTGSAFQRRVWQVISAIPAGRTRTYGEIAAELGSAPRAVGGACRANPYPLLVPCHRVVGASGLGGFAGDRSGRLLAVKRWLLAHEGALIPA